MKQVLFIQGGGDDGYKADEPMVNSLKKTLGKEFDISYPSLDSDEAAPDFGWIKQIREKIHDDIILVGHSLGASMILRYLSENTLTKKINGIFLLATPFWGGDEDWKAGLKLKVDFAANLPTDVPMFLYQCKDDEEVPYSQFDQYKQQLHRATFREITSGGHQFNNDLNFVADDIRSL